MNTQKQDCSIGNDRPKETGTSAQSLIVLKNDSEAGLTLKVSSMGRDLGIIKDRFYGQECNF
jgi:hypothetical protein